MPVDFSDAQFSGTPVLFRGRFGFSGKVDFRYAKFSGGTVFFGGRLSGGMVDFSHVNEWSQPPQFDWGDGVPPEGVTLPAESGGTPP